MNTLAFLSAAVALLACAGWLIGWQIARAPRFEDDRLIVIVADAEIHPSLQSALSRLGKEPHHYSLLTEVPSETERFVRVTTSNDGYMICRATVQTPASYALQLVPVGLSPSADDWTAVALTALYQLNVSIQSLGPPSAQSTAIDDDYCTAWHAMQQGDQHSLRTAHRILSEIVARWPDTRHGEMSCILANLADVCSRLDEDPQRRLARLLQGLDAAREALRLQYSVAEPHRMTGLRTLIHQLRTAVSIHERAAKSNGSTTVQPRSEVRRARTTKLEPQASDTSANPDCPQANALVGNDTGVPASPNLL